MSAVERMIGGRVFFDVGESTVAHDLHFAGLVSRAGIDSIAMADGESPADYSDRLVNSLLGRTDVLSILACGLIPADRVKDPSDPGGSWTPAVATETAEFLGGLRAPEDKAAIRGLIASTAAGLFQAGIVSLKTSATSSRSGKDSDPRDEEAVGTAAGPSLSAI